MLSQQYYTPCATTGLYKLNLTPTFGSASYQISLQFVNYPDNGVRLQSTVTLVSTGPRLFEGQSLHLSPTEEDGHCRRLIHSTEFGRGGRPAEDEEAALNWPRQDRILGYARLWRGNLVLVPVLG